MTGSLPALQAQGLVVDLDQGGRIVDNVTLQVDRGELLGLVGESGSGKTTLALALLGHARRGCRISAGSVTVGGADVLGAGVQRLRELRSRLISYVPQDPATALNPGMRIGAQLREAVGLAQMAGERRDILSRCLELLRSVRLPADQLFLRRYPHQLSGGQLQRVAIAIALAGNPEVLIMDEPTTGLDVTTQAEILRLIGLLVHEHDVASVYVSHDLAVVASLATRIAVMYSGQIVEIGQPETTLAEPLHPYTKGLLAAAPTLHDRSNLRPIPGQSPSPWSRPLGCLFGPRCSWHADACSAARPVLRQTQLGSSLVACVRAEEIRAAGGSASGRSKRGIAEQSPSVQPAALEVRQLVAAYGRSEVLHGVSFELREGTCLAVVGESGSGKTTLARILAGLHQQVDGEVILDGEALSKLPRQRSVQARCALQYIFQNPDASLNPRRSVAKSIAEPLRRLRGASVREAEAHVSEALDRTGLPASLRHAYPDQLSGGQRQRVAIARALAVRPSVLICDEITSALDVSVQAVIIELLRELQATEHLSLLFITHNLGLASTLADEVLVLREGQIVEHGPTAEVLKSPADPYTRNLLSDIPTLEGADSFGDKVKAATDRQRPEVQTAEE
jgi:peptide/nickel transport system ATP-binding protein